jgi:hypothetical protein
MVKQILTISVVSLAGLVLTANASLAAPRGVVALPAESVFQTKVSGKSVTCGNVPPWAPGRLMRGNFYPSSAEIRNLNQQLKRTASSTKRTAIQRKLAIRKAYRKLAQGTCKNGPPTSGARFDAQGNVTLAGKVAFGIPLSMNANVNLGIGVWNTTCRGCHQTFPSALSIRSYPGILARIQLSPMLFQIPSEVTEEQIAHVTAFANFIGGVSE